METAASLVLLLFVTMGVYSVVSWLFPTEDSGLHFVRGVVAIFVGPGITAGLLYVSVGGLRPRQPDIHERFLDDLGVDKPPPGWWPPKSLVELRRFNRRRARAEGRPKIHVDE